MLVRCGAIFGPPKVWVSNTDTHFRNGFVTVLAETSGVNKTLAAGHSACTIRTVANGII